MWLLEIVKSYHKIHAKQSNICCTLPKDKLHIFLLLIFRSFAHDTNSFDANKGDGTDTFYLYIISHREGSAEMFYSHFIAKLQPRLRNAFSVHPRTAYLRFSTT